MPNMQKEKTPMPHQPADARAKNFSEVALGYTESEAKNEAARCLGCKNRPCVAGCPVGVPIPEFIAEIEKGNFAGAYEFIRGQNTLPAVCGRVCPQETQCEALCVRGKKGEPVAIGRLERFAADYPRAKTAAQKPAANGKRAAIVGSGPAGLTCAGELARRGFDVTVYEAFHVAGGVLVYGIPEFRLPKAVVEDEINALKELGVKVETNMVVGRVLTVDELLEQFDSVFLGVGAGLPSFMGVPGEGLVGVYSANEFLTRVNLMKAYLPDSDTPVLPSRRTAVVGGGNVAMDAARCALRMGADEVVIVYRRGEEEMPARREEIHHAAEEGIKFELLTAPVEVKGDETGRVEALVCRKMALGEPDASGRRRPEPVPGSDFTLEVDTVIVAVGTSPNPLIGQTTDGLTINKWGCIETNPETGETSRPGVFSGGDAATGAATVILAMGAGKKAAETMTKYMDR